MIMIGSRHVQYFIDLFSDAKTLCKSTSGIWIGCVQPKKWKWKRKKVENKSEWWYCTHLVSKITHWTNKWKKHRPTFFHSTIGLCKHKNRIQHFCLVVDTLTIFLRCKLFCRIFGWYRCRRGRYIYRCWHFVKFFFFFINHKCNASLWQILFEAQTQLRSDSLCTSKETPMNLFRKSFHAYSQQFYMHRIP